MKRIFAQGIATLLLATLAVAAHAGTPAELQRLTAPLKLTLEQAIAQVQHTVPGTVIAIELDDDAPANARSARYEAEVLSASGEQIEVVVDGVSGRAHQSGHDGNARRQDKARAAQAQMTLEQAVQTAVAQAPGRSRALKAELDSHWGKVSYEVEVMTVDFAILEIKIDAITGHVIRVERE